MLTLITGASAGLGAEMARQLAERGHDLVLTARRVDRLEELAGEILAKHPELRVEVAELDVTDEEQVFEVFRRFAPLDRVIVNAGVRSAKMVGTGGHADNLAVGRTNFLAALAQIEAAMEQFRNRGRGHLVVISSVAAMRGLLGGPGCLCRHQARDRAPRRGLALRDVARKAPDNDHHRLPGLYPHGDDGRRDRHTVHRRYPDRRARDRLRHRGR
jgi:NAD(P)-dependent dehydrogenase (short-subunit alcohol dehydrogenase family)